MPEHVDAVKRAIEFNKPPYLPMEIINVPGVYNAYHTLDPETVRFVPGSEDFDALWTCCYSWCHDVIGATPEGEILKKDQWGVVLKTPLDMNSAYMLLEHPLADDASLEGYEFPDPDATNPHYEKLGAAIRERYPDRFVNGYIDPGLFLTTQLLFGMQRFLLKVADDPNRVANVYERVMEYYRALVPKYKSAGAHMITVIEDLGGPDSLLINPAVWRSHFKPTLTKLFRYVHEQGLYTGILIDGNSRQVLDDLLDMHIDVLTVVDVNTTGLDLIKEKLAGKMCIKATVDMQTTLPSASPEHVAEEARRLVDAFHSPDGGFICEVVRWHRPEFPEPNVLASARAFNAYRNL